MTLAVLPVFALLVAAPAGPEDGCPSGRQVTEAMQARFPALLVMPNQSVGSTRTDVLRASLDVAPDGTVVRFSLVDARGEVQLRRALPAPGPSRSVSDCVALADTVAAIVERFLGTISYDSAETPQTLKPDAPDTGIGIQPAPAPVLASNGRRAALAFLGMGWRTTAGTQTGWDQSGPEGRLGTQFQLIRTSPRLMGTLSVGAALSRDIGLPDVPRQATFRRFPARLGILLALPGGRGWVEPVLQTGADVLVVSSTRRDSVPATLNVLFTPVIEGGIAYRLRIAGRFYLRPAVTIGAPLTVYKIGVADRTGPNAVEGTPILTTPRAYASFGIDAAVVFR